MMSKPRLEDLDCLYSVLFENKDARIDMLPNLAPEQKEEMKAFFRRNPSLEKMLDWNRPESITYDSYRELADEHPAPIDPDTVEELYDKQLEAPGVYSYEVQDDEEGQAAMRRIIDTHWGKDSNPWCLLAYETPPDKTEFFIDGRPIEWDLGAPEGTAVRYLESNKLDFNLAIRALNKSIEKFSGSSNPAAKKVVERGIDARELLMSRRISWKKSPPPKERNFRDDAFDYWQDYSELPKRVAFKNGKLLAFMATNRVVNSHNDWLFLNDTRVDELGNPIVDDWTNRRYFLRSLCEELPEELQDLGIDLLRNICMEVYENIGCAEFVDLFDVVQTADEVMNRFCQQQEPEVAETLKNWFQVYITFNCERRYSRDSAVVWWDRNDRPHNSLDEIIYSRGGRR